MKVLALAYAAILSLAFAGTAMAQATRPQDTGNMAYPNPVPQGNLGKTITPRQAPDTGSARYQTPTPQGNIGTTRTVGPNRPTDTGNMAYPTPVPQGNVGTTRAK
jgi:hypothetical protein